jgi:hypothetical protein
MPKPKWPCPRLIEAIFWHYTGVIESFKFPKRFFDLFFASWQRNSWIPSRKVLDISFVFTNVKWQFFLLPFRTWKGSAASTQARSSSSALHCTSWILVLCLQRYYRNAISKIYKQFWIRDTIPNCVPYPGMFQLAGWGAIKRESGGQ